MLKKTDKIISSVDNPLVKSLVKLREDRRYREERQEFILSGHKVIQEVCATHAPRLVVVLEGVSSPFPGDVVYVSKKVLAKITGVPSPDGIAALFPFPPSSSLKNLPLIVALDGISDPGNLGTIFRTAQALGWKGVFLLPGCVDPFQEKVVRASRGALVRLSWRRGNWEELRDLVKQEGLTPYVADMEGESVLTVAKGAKKLLLLSCEGQGVSREGEAFGKKVTVEMRGEMESLNVAIAGSILMYVLGSDHG